MLERELGSSPTRADSDGDGISDALEDYDFDGRSNLREIQEGTDPLAPTLALHRGLNLIHYPMVPEPGMTAFDLLEMLGGPGVVGSITRFDTSSGIYEKAWYQQAEPAGIDFSVEPTHGYWVEAIKSATVEFSGVLNCSKLHLMPGINVVGVSCIPQDMDAYTLLEQFGKNGVNAIEAYDPVADRFQAVTVHDGVIVGTNFKFNSVSAFRINMSRERETNAFALAPATLEVTSHRDGDFVSEPRQTVQLTLNAAAGSVMVNGIEAQLISQNENHSTYAADINLALGTNRLVFEARGENDLLRTVIREVFYGKPGNGTDGDDILVGTNGRDTIDGGAGSDIIYGLDGNDTLSGGGSDSAPGDLLIGGRGSDRLSQSARYKFYRGDGSDTIVDPLDGYSLIFGPGIGITDLDFAQPDRNTLRLIYGQGDSIDMDALVVGGKQRLQRIELEHATLDAQAIRDRIFSEPPNRSEQNVFYLTTLADQVHAGNYMDIIYGVPGGADIVDAGPGNDYIHYDERWGWTIADYLAVSEFPVIIGGPGNDIFRLNEGMAVAFELQLGDGQDYLEAYADVGVSSLPRRSVELRFGEGIRQQNIAIFDGGYCESWCIAYSPDDYFAFDDATRDYQLAILEGKVPFDLVFADGTRVALSQLLAAQIDASVIVISEPGLTTRGDATDNRIYTSTGDDTIEAGRGDDRIISRGGINQYIYHSGDGHDSIQGPGEHRIILGDGVFPAQVSVSNRHAGNRGDLVFNLGDRSSAITIQDYWDHSGGAIYPETAQLVSLEFQSTGAVWTHETFIERMNLGSAGADTFYLYGFGAGTEDVQYEFNGGPGDDLFLSESTDGAIFHYAPGDGSDQYQLVAGGDPFYPTRMSSNNVWNLGTIERARAGFRIENDALVIRIDDDPAQELSIRSAFAVNQPGGSELVGQIIFADGNLDYAGVIAQLAQDPTGTQYLIADGSSASVIGSPLADIIAVRTDAVDITGGGDDTVIQQYSGSITFSFSGGGTKTILGETDNDLLNFPAGTRITPVVDPLLYGLEYQVLEYELASGETGAVRFNSVYMEVGFGNASEPYYRLRKRNGIEYRGIDRAYLDGSALTPPRFDYGHDNRLRLHDKNPEDYWPIYGTSPNTGDNAHYNGMDLIHGGDLNEFIVVEYGEDTIYAGHGDDFIDGGGSADTIYAGDGNDIIYSGGSRSLTSSYVGGSRLVDTGRGNDIFFPDSQSDRLRFELGHGNDIIRTEGTRFNFSIDFGEFIDFADRRYERHGPNLLIKYSPSDSVLIEGFFVFVDGRWEKADHTLPGFPINEQEMPGFHDLSEAPVAQDDVLVGIVDEVNVIAADQLLGNDVDPDGDRLLITAVSNAQGATVTLHATSQAILVTADTGALEATFDYTCADSSGATSTAQVRMAFSQDGSRVFRVGEVGNIAGSADNDLIYYGLRTINGPAVDGGDGFDSVFSMDASNGGEHNDTLVFSSIKNVELIDGGVGFNRVTGDGDDNIMDFTSTWFHRVQSIHGGAGNDTIHGSRHSVVDIYGDAGDDLLFGGDGGDRIYGGEGDDLLFGGPGSDALYGGPGDDLLHGGEGLDAYHWRPGDGNDVIANYSFASAGYHQPGDGLVFNRGLIDGEYRWPLFEDFDWARNQDDDLLIRLRASGETITVHHWFRSADYRLAYIESQEKFDMAQVELLANQNIVDTPPVVPDESPAGLSGAAIYLAQCAACHGSNGQGPVELTGYINTLPLTQLTSYIERRMPLGRAGHCVGECAASVGDYIAAFALPMDTDSDGVEDAHDLCPDTPDGDRMVFDGCSESQDADNDGVFGPMDHCPDTPFGATVDAVGCPSDTDGDSVLDGLDQCPATPPGEAIDAYGCADSQKDADNDGVSDDIDQCPRTTADTSVDSNGCSAYQLDDDNDGVVNANDLCPDSGHWTPVDDEGCFNDVPNLLASNGTFSEGGQSWQAYLPGGSVSWVGHADVAIDTPSGSLDSMQLWHELDLQAGQTYILCFYAKADAQRNISYRIDEGAPDYGVVDGLYSNSQDVGTEFRLIRRTFRPGLDLVGGRLVLNVGGSDAGVQIDNIGVYAGHHCGVPGEEVGTAGGSGKNLIASDGTFSNGRGQQNFFALLPTGDSVTWNEEVSIALASASPSVWEAQLIHPVRVEQGKVYTACLDAKADAARTIQVTMNSGAPGYSDIVGGAQVLALSTEYQAFSRSFIASGSYDAAAFVLYLGGSDIDVQLDNIGLFEGSECGKFETAEPGETGESLLFSDGSFGTGKQGFNAYFAAGIDVDVTWQDEVHVAMNGASAQLYEGQIYHPLAVEDGEDYVACFDARASAPRNIQVYVDSGNPDYATLIGSWPMFSLGTQYVSYSLPFTPTQTDSTARFLINVGGSDIDVFLDNVYVYQGGTCPEPVIADEDGDGVEDARDQCPGTPASTAVNAMGCGVGENPDDADGDGVNDAIDNCDNTPLGTPVDGFGCPLVQPTLDVTCEPGELTAWWGGFVLSDVAVINNETGWLTRWVVNIQFNQPINIVDNWAATVRANGEVAEAQNTFNLGPEQTVEFAFQGTNSGNNLQVIGCEVVEAQ